MIKIDKTKNYIFLLLLALNNFLTLHSVLSSEIERSSSCNLLYLQISCVFHPITKCKNTRHLLRLCLNFSSSVTNDSHSEREHAVHPLSESL